MWFDLGLLILRVVVGLVLWAHGAQKLLGWYGGPGQKGVTGWLHSTGLRPARFWAFMAAISEFGGGLLLLLGLLSPLGSIGIIASMLTAIRLVHWGKGLWVGQGGMELALTNLAAVLALALTGPGAYSLDAILGIALPEPVTLLVGLALVVFGVIAVFVTRARQPVQAAPAGGSKT